MVLASLAASGSSGEMTGEGQVRVIRKRVGLGLGVG